MLVAGWELVEVLLEVAERREYWAEVCCQASAALDLASSSRDL